VACVITINCYIDSLNSGKDVIDMKDKLLAILKNPAGKVLAIDLDGTICHGEFWGEGDPAPQQDFIDKMWVWYKKGAHVIIYTARQPIYYPETHAWLIKNRVPFHGIVMQMKPGADCYLDDKALNVEDIP
jgi:hypothetical protein